MAAFRTGANQAASPSYWSDFRLKRNTGKWPNRNRYPTVSNPVHNKRPPDSHDSEESLSGGPNSASFNAEERTWRHVLSRPPGENATEYVYVELGAGCASIPQKM